MNLIAEISERGPFLVDHLVAVANRAAAAHVILHITPDLEVRSPATPQGISRDELLELSRQLLDDRPTHDALIRCLQNERVFDLTGIEHFDQGTLLLRPMLRLDWLRDLKYRDSILRAVSPSSSSFSDLHARFPPTPPSANSNFGRTAHLLSASDPSGLISMELIVELQYRALTDRHAAALRLALRLYEIDHRGQLPPDLASLVPQYLPALPADIFHPRGGPFTYLPARRLFYSWGSNGVDDGAATSPIVYATNWRSLDTVYPLDRPAAVIPPSSPISAPPAP